MIQYPSEMWRSWFEFKVRTYRNYLWSIFSLFLLLFKLNIRNLKRRLYLRLSLWFHEATNGIRCLQGPKNVTRVKEKEKRKPSSPCGSGDLSGGCGLDSQQGSSSELSDGNCVTGGGETRLSVEICPAGGRASWTLSCFLPPLVPLGLPLCFIRRNPDPQLTPVL